MLVPTGVPLKAGDLKKTGQALLRDLLAREAVFDVQFTEIDRPVSTGELSGLTQ